METKKNLMRLKERNRRTMEQDFAREGDQYQQRSDAYPGDSYAIDLHALPPGENDWTVNPPQDNVGSASETPAEELPHLWHFFASNNGIPGAFRPRPAQRQTAAPSTREALFASTQRLPSANNQELAPTPALQGDVWFNNFDVRQGAIERCGCVPLSFG